jgi:hypothetical protein
VDARTDGGFYILGERAKIAAHFSHSFFENTLDCTAPACVEHSDSFLLGIYQNDGQAIGCLDADENAGGAGDETIAYQWFLRQIFHAVSEIGVNLAQGD